MRIIFMSKEFIKNLSRKKMMFWIKELLKHKED